MLQQKAKVRNPSSMQVTKLRLKAEMLNESSVVQIPMLLANDVSQFALSRLIATGVLVRNGIAKNGRGSGQKQPSQTALVVSYDICINMHQMTSKNWEFQNIRIPYDGSQHTDTLQINIDTPTSLLVHQGLSSGQIRGQNSSGFVFVEDGVYNGQKATS